MKTMPQLQLARALRRGGTILAVPVLLLAEELACAAVRYVDVNSVNPTPPYTNWATAATNIQDAVDAAMPGDEIVVTNGVYATGGRPVGTSFLTNRVAVDKPVVVRSFSGPAVTLIVGAAAPTDGNGDGAIRCVYLTNGAVLSGFTLTNGHTRTIGDVFEDRSGGGVRGFWPCVVTNCTLTGNSAGDSGGGAYGSILHNCTLTNNGASEYGGGAQGSTLLNCLVTANQSKNGGAGAWVAFEDCVLSNNSATWGGAAYFGSLRNCLIISNSATVNGGGGWKSDFLIGCTVVGNTAGGAGGGAYFCALRNCIVFYNAAASGQNHSDSTLHYSCTTPLPPGGVGNITNEPIFVDGLNGNLRLQPNSPCINAGNNAYVSGNTDLDGNPRIVCGKVDMGAYEFTREFEFPDLFIFQQMDRFDSIRPTDQPPLIQSYACFDPSDPDNYLRGDVYDQAVAICYLLARGHIWRAQRLADALLFLQNDDPNHDGRLHAAYCPTNLLPSLSTNCSGTSIKDPNVSPGNMSWAGIGLAKTFVATGEEKYFIGAQRCADWILNHLHHTNWPGGFSGGLLGTNCTPAAWRATEHNIDVYALAMGLFNLTHDPKWWDMADSAAGFVRAMYTNATPPGHYFTGTGDDGVTVNPSPIPADGQSWSALAGLDIPDRATNALAWMWANLLVNCRVGADDFEGIKAAERGSGVSSEQTAGAAMAYAVYGDSARANKLLADLQCIQLRAASCDTSGIVAAPCDGCSSNGFEGCLPQKPHVASTAWTGLAYLVANGDATANPLKPIPGTPIRISREGSTVCLWWPSISAMSYSILVSTNVALGLTNWNVIPVGQTNRWCDPEDLQIGNRFYYLKLD